MVALSMHSGYLLAAQASVGTAAHAVRSLRAVMRSVVKPWGCFTYKHVTASSSFLKSRSEGPPPSRQTCISALHALRRSSFGGSSRSLAASPQNIRLQPRRFPHRNKHTTFAPPPHLSSPPTPQTSRHLHQPANPLRHPTTANMREIVRISTPRQGP